MLSSYSALCSANVKKSVFLRRIPLASEKMDGRVLTHGWRGNPTDETTSVHLRFIFLSVIFLSDVFVSFQSEHGLRAKPAPRFWAISKDSAMCEEALVCLSMSTLDSAAAR